MELRDRVAVVTGAASGIGRELARRFASDGARGVVVADVDTDGANAVAADLGDVGLSISADVAVEADIEHLVAQTERRFGAIDLFCSNAGVIGGGGVEVPDEVWQQTWSVNVMAHVYAARAVVPGMIERGGGYLLTTASAAGLLTAIGNAPYAVTKHAAVAFAEWLAITYGDRGIKVSCLCPQGVRTKMLEGAEADVGGAAVLGEGVLETEAVADAVIEGLRAERFLILPHPEVADYEQRRAADRDRWLAGMRRLQSRLFASLESG